jgi:hypothetical protein
MNLTALDSPVFLKVAAGAALYFMGGSRLAKMGGLALAAWGGWDYLQQRPRTLFQAPAVGPGTPISPWSRSAQANLGSWR